MIQKLNRLCNAVYLVTFCVHSLARSIIISSTLEEVAKSHFAFFVEVKQLLLIVVVFALKREKTRVKMAI